jgi:hypothetical protein
MIAPRGAALRLRRDEREMNARQPLRDASDRADEAIAAARQRLDPALAARLARKHYAERSDLHCEIAVLDGEAGPRRLDQLGLRENDSPALPSALNSATARRPTGSGSVPR